MDISYDYKDLFKTLNRRRVKYLVVGAYAVIFYSEPRFTKDLDIWVKPDVKNAAKVYKALKEFGAPLRDITIGDFTNKRLFFQMGIAPVRVDIIMGLGNIDFDFAWKKKKKSQYAGITINVIGLKELKKSKLISKRPQDLLDLEKLNRIN